MPRHLIQHVLQKRDSRVEFTFPSTIQVQRDFDLGFQGIAFYCGRPISHLSLPSQAIFACQPS